MRPAGRFWGFVDGLLVWFDDRAMLFVRAAAAPRRARLCRLLFVLAVLALVQAPAQAQTLTAVSATIKDPQNVPYSSAVIRFGLDGLGGQVPSLTPCSGPAAGCQFQLPGPVTADATGHFSVNLYANASILPGGTQWHLYVTIAAPPQVGPPIGTGPQSFDLAVTISGATQDLSSALSGIAKSLSNITGGGGGGATPVAPAFAAQLANSTVTNLATASGANSQSFGVDAIPATTEVVPFSESVAGPRPRIDVTAYGAKGDGVTDDTTAIQAAINAACSGTVNNMSVLFFPPGAYKVSQPQTPSTSPVFTGLCAQLTIEGAGGNSASQFASSPMSRVSAAAGANPNAAPVFNTGGFNGITFRDISIVGQNQAVYVQGGNGITFDNVGLLNQATAQTDNVPLKISAALQLSWDAGFIQAPDGSHDDVLIIGADTGGTETQPAGLIFFNGARGNFWIGNGIHYSQRVNTCCSGPGNMHVWNVLVEDNVGALFRITNDSGNSGTIAMPTFHDLDLKNFNGSDGCVGVTCAVVNFNSSGSQLLKVQVENTSMNGNGAYAVQMSAGTLTSCFATGAATKIEDGSGNFTGACAFQNNTGFDYTINASDFERLTANMHDADGASFRSAIPPNQFASLAIDPSFGLLLGTGTSYGYDSGIQKEANYNLDVAFATVEPPTSVTATPAAGGSLTPGTYWYYVRATTNPSCSVMSAPSIISNSATNSGGNLENVLTWTLPASGPGTSAGYCVFRATTSADYTVGEQMFSIFVSGASTTTFTDTGAGFGCCNLVAPYAPMSAVHRFTPSAYFPVVAGATSVGIATNPVGDVDIGAASGVYEDFNVTQLTGHVTTTVPNANTVLPQPLTTGARLVVNGLSGSTGALSNSTQGQCPGNGGTNPGNTAYAISGSGDFGCIIDQTITSVQTDTIAQAGTGAFTGNWYTVLYNDSASTANLSLTATTSTFSCSPSSFCSGSTLSGIPPGARVYIFSPNNSSYTAFVSGVSSGSNPSFPQTVSGTVTSGGIPCFTSTIQESSSGLLALSHVLLGGGAGACPTSDAQLDDGATAASTLTYGGGAETIGPTPPAVTPGTAGGISYSEGTAPTGVSGSDTEYANSTNHCLDAMFQTVDKGCVVTFGPAACTNAELSLSTGWGSTASVSAVAGIGYTCQWTLTSSGTGQAANPTITDTFVTANQLPQATIVCSMAMTGGTGASTLINQTTLSAVAPVFTFGGTPVAASTYIVVRRCGP